FDEAGDQCRHSFVKSRRRAVRCSVFDTGASPKDYGAPKQDGKSVGAALVPMPPFTQSRAIRGPPITGSRAAPKAGGICQNGRAPSERSGPVKTTRRKAAAFACVASRMNREVHRSVI